MKPLLSLCIILFLINQGNIHAQIDSAQWSNKAIIWQGFSHKWTYNHRLNRLGNYVRTLPNGAEIIHTSATGLGKDSVNFTTFYTQVESNDFRFHQGSTRIKLVGKEGKMLNETIDVMIPFSNELASNYPDFQTVLNGFDITSLQKADKLQALKLNISKPYYNKLQNTLHFKIDILLVTNCKSLECSRLNNKTAYQVDVYYLVSVGKPSTQINQETFTENYSWDKKIELKPKTSEKKININNNLAKHILGIKNISIFMDRGHWMLDWFMYFIPTEFDPISKRLNLLTNFHLKEWSAEMFKFSVAPKTSQLAVKKKGWISQSLGLQIFSFDEGQFKIGQTTGAANWLGKNQSPNNDKAIHRTIIPTLTPHPTKPQ